MFPVEDEIPLLFWPNEWAPGREDVTESVRASRRGDAVLPNYDDFDRTQSLASKSARGVFARMLDEQVPPGARVLECGCGTGQLSNFLSIANRSVFAADLCLNSLRLGRAFARRQGLERVHFLQMNLFRPALRPASFDLVISNGVLHHTSDPFLAFRSIAQLVRPGGYLLVGLYHRWGRLITDARRIVYRLSGGRFRGLDPNLRSARSSEAKKRAWFADQYQHPHESKHTIGETLRWLDEIGFGFVKSIPRSRLFQPIGRQDSLFAPEVPGASMERTLVELGMALRGSREGGFFVVIGQRPATATR